MWSLTHLNYILCIMFSPLDCTPHSHLLQWWRQCKGKYLVGPFVKDYLPSTGPFQSDWAILKQLGHSEAPTAVAAAKTGQVTNSDPGALVLTILDALISCALNSTMRHSHHALGQTGCYLQALIQSTPSWWRRPVAAVVTFLLHLQCGFQSCSSNYVCACPNRPGSNL